MGVIYGKRIKERERKGQKQTRKSEREKTKPTERREKRILFFKNGRKNKSKLV